MTTYAELDRQPQRQLTQMARNTATEYGATTAYSAALNAAPIVQAQMVTGQRLNRSPSANPVQRTASEATIEPGPVQVLDCGQASKTGTNPAETRRSRPYPGLGGRLAAAD